jgi:hypothetical protein
MAEGLLAGLGRLVGIGAAYLEHLEFVQRAQRIDPRALPAELTLYVQALTDASVAGFKVTLAMLLNKEQDDGQRQLLQLLLGSIDAARAGQLAVAPPAPVAALAPARPEVRTFEQDLEVAGGWHDLPGEARAQAIVGHLEALSPAAYQSFRTHLDQMTANTRTRLAKHEASESQSWGGFAEDRMSYLMASIRTRQRDPAFVRRLEEIQGYLRYFEGLCQLCDVVWKKLLEERQREQASTHKPSIRENGIPVAELRAELDRRLTSGEVRPERGPKFHRLLDKVEVVMRQMQDPSTDLKEKTVLIDRWKALMAEIQGAFADPGGAARLAGLPSGSRARALDPHISNMKAFLFRELKEVPPGHTGERAAEIMGDVMKAQQLLGQLAEDAAALAMEREVLRPAAVSIQDYVLRNHLMLARPLWECAEAVIDASAVFYGGPPDLADALRPLAEARQLHLKETVTGKNFGQGRWDSLRTSYISVFDLSEIDDPAQLGRRAEVAYELGLALALGRPVVVVAAEADGLPFDVDVAPCLLAGDEEANVQALGAALDNALYDRQRTSRSSSLAATWNFLDGVVADHPMRSTFEESGILDPGSVVDPVGLAGNIRHILRFLPESRLQMLYPSWAGAYPDSALPSCFHVMPFGQPWSNQARDAARRACGLSNVQYRRGDEAEEGRIIQAIWGDLCCSQLVIVDLTGLNLNVLIELGMAHALGRDVLLVRRQGDPSPRPRNIEKLRVLEYGSPAALEELVLNRLRATRKAG